MPALIARSSAWWAMLVQGYLSRRDTNRTSLAQRMRVSESTIRKQLANGYSPSVDKLIATRDEIPDELLESVLNALAGSRFQVTRACPQSFVNTPLVPFMFDVEQEMVRALEHTVAHERDGVWTAEEAAESARDVAGLIQKLLCFRLSAEKRAGTGKRMSPAWRRA